jgi:hypothetical protein
MGKETVECIYIQHVYESITVFKKEILGGKHGLSGRASA